MLPKEGEIQLVTPFGSKPRGRLLHGELIVMGELEVERLGVYGI